MAENENSWVTGYLISSGIKMFLLSLFEVLNIKNRTKVVYRSIFFFIYFNAQHANQILKH